MKFQFPKMTTPQLIGYAVGGVLVRVMAATSASAAVAIGGFSTVIDGVAIEGYKADHGTTIVQMADNGSVAVNCQTGDYTFVGVANEALMEKAMAFVCD